MKPILFQLNGNLTDGRYLLGEYQWPYPVLLQRAACGCDDLPTGGQMTLTLEVGGVLTLFSFTVTAGGVINPLLNLSWVVPANTSIRWHASFTGAVEETADSVAVVVYPTMPAAASPPLLVLRWFQNGVGSVLFNYDPVSYQFTEVSPGIAAGRVTIEQSPDATSFIIGGVTALSVADGICSANGLNAAGAATTEEPQLQFMANGAVVGVLTASALHVAGLVEGMPLADDAAFEFYNAGILTASLSGNTGLTALALREGDA